MKIIEKEYKSALKRIDKLLPLVTDDTPVDAPNLIELLKVSNIVEEYEDGHYPIINNIQKCMHLDAIYLNTALINHFAQ